MTVKRHQFRAWSAGLGLAVVIATLTWLLAQPRVAATLRTGRVGTETASVRVEAGVSSSAPQPTSEGSSDPGATLIVRTIRSGTGLPVSSEVRVYAQSADTSVEALASGQSDSTGVASFRGLSLGVRLRLCAHSLDGSLRSLTDAEVVTVDAPEVRTTVSLFCGVDISGRVVDTLHGSPIPGATVIHGSSGLVTGQETPVSGDGSFKLRTNFGLVTLSALAPGYARSATWRRRVQPDATGSLQADFALEPARPVGGRIVDDRGVPIEAARVFAFFATQSSRSLSDGNGSFALDNVPPGHDIDLHVLAPKRSECEYVPRVEIVLPPTLDGGSLRIVMARASRVAGRWLNDRGAPLRAAMVRLWKGGADPGKWASEQEVATDDDGAFAFRGLSAGRFAIGLGEEAPPRPLGEAGEPGDSRARGSRWIGVERICGNHEVLDMGNLVAPRVFVLAGVVVDPPGWGVTPEVGERTAWVRPSGDRRRRWVPVAGDGRFNVTAFEDELPLEVGISQQGRELCAPAMVTRMAGEPIMLRVEVESPGRVDVRALRANETPILYYDVVLSGRDRRFTMHRLVKSSSGIGRIAGIPPGRYDLTVTEAGSERKGGCEIQIPGPAECVVHVD